MLASSLADSVKGLLTLEWSEPIGSFTEFIYLCGSFKFAANILNLSQSQILL